MQWISSALATVQGKRKLVYSKQAEASKLDVYEHGNEQRSLPYLVL
jgi:hypothetical protein